MRLSFYLSLSLLLLVPWPLTGGSGVHTTYLWHLQQPIYWPDRNSAGDHYEYAWESIQATDAGRANPENNLRDIFGKADRVAVYQTRARDSIGSILWSPDAGAQINYSGCLIENIRSLGEANQLGYSPSWNSALQEARNWTTSGGQPRADIIQFTFHHALPALIDPMILKRDIQIYQQIYADAWGASPGISKGFFPAEIAFSERIIPTLVELGIEWVVVANNHISRAVENFPLVLGTGGENTEPPNRADQVNPAQPLTQVFRKQIDRGCSPANFYPYSMRPHYAQYIDPNSGQVSKIIVVPAEMAISWDDGYACIGTTSIDQFAWANDPAKPMLVLLAHDGDNAFGGGFSYYLECVPNFVSEASSKGYSPTTVQQYLTDHPVDPNDIVHVEDGPWVNADGDFGSPTFSNWNWPLMNQQGQVDIANGWAEDERNWAVYTAAVNRVVTAEQVFGSAPDLRKIIYPWEGANDLEYAWHFLLGGTASGYMYYGKVLDMEVKPTVASNESVFHADNIIGSAPIDLTPPTIWIPQRYPYNPGDLNFGPIYGYKEYYAPLDFWVWTFIYDVSGLQSVSFKYRIDNDGTNPLSSSQNETYQGGPEVGTWQSLPMTARTFPKDNVFNDPEINFTELPQYIADEYYVNVDVPTLKNVLIDYYVEAVDQRGNIAKSPIQHVWIGDGSNASGGANSSVSWAPSSPTSKDPITITKIATTAETMYLHWGVNGWTLPDSSYWPPGSIQYDAQSIESPMTNTGGDTFQVTIGPFSGTQTVSQVNFVFRWGSTWDNNNGSDYGFSVTQATIDTEPPSAPLNLTPTAGDQKVDLAWSANSEPDLAGYYVYRLAPGDPGFSRITPSLLTSPSYSDTGLNNGSNYLYYVTAVDDAETPNESPPSDSVSSTPGNPDVTPPKAPTGITTTPLSLAIRLSWTANLETDLAGYRVFHSLTSGGPWTQVTDTTATIVTDTGLSPNTPYFFIVTAYDNSGNSSDSSLEVSDTPLPDPPPAIPTGLTATSGNAEVTLTWTANSEPDLAGYKVYGSLLGTPLVLLADTNVTTVTVSGLTNDSTYQFAVLAYDSFGVESALSDTVTATPAEFILVHFSVDLSSSGLTPESVSIAGDLLNPPWTPSANYMAEINTNVLYAIDIPLQAGVQFQYKYVSDNTNWEPDFPAGPSINREITATAHSPGEMWVHNVWAIDGDLKPKAPSGSHRNQRRRRSRPDLERARRSRYPGLSCRL